MPSKNISNKVKRVVKLISDFCIMNHSENFCCEFQITGYVNWIEVKLSSGGSETPVKVLKLDYIAMDNNSFSFKNLTEAYREMVEFKKWHDFNFSSGEQDRLKKEAAARRVAMLKDELAEAEKCL